MKQDIRVQGVLVKLAALCPYFYTPKLVSLTAQPPPQTHPHTARQQPPMQTLTRTQARTLPQHPGCSHLCQSCIGWQALLNRHLPHQHQVVVKAQHLPAGRHHHQHLLSGGADLLRWLSVNEAHTHGHLEGGACAFTLDDDRTRQHTDCRRGMQNDERWSTLTAKPHQERDAIGLLCFSQSLPKPSIHTQRLPSHFQALALSPMLPVSLSLTGRLSLPSMTFCGIRLKLRTTSTGAKPSPARPAGSGRTSCRTVAVQVQANGGTGAGQWQYTGCEEAVSLSVPCGLWRGSAAADGTIPAWSADCRHRR